MTKERSLAIEMWTNIRDMIAAPGRVTRETIVRFKSKFCRDHELDWEYNCWFCQYIPHCGECPLKGCDDGFYAIALADYREKDVRVSACNYIIKALGGKYDK